MQKTLTRSQTDRWIAGVCGGIAAYAGIPAIFIRLLWIAVCIIIWVPVPFLVGILLYFLAWLLIPAAPRRKAVSDPNAIDVEYEVTE